MSAGDGHEAALRRLTASCCRARAAHRRCVEAGHGDGSLFRELERDHAELLEHLPPDGRPLDDFLDEDELRRLDQAPASALRMLHRLETEACAVAEEVLAAECPEASARHVRETVVPRLMRHIERLGRQLEEQDIPVAGPDVPRRRDEED